MQYRYFEQDAAIAGGYYPIKPVPTVIPIEELYGLGQTLREPYRTLYYYLYLTGCRVSEAVGIPASKLGSRERWRGLMAKDVLPVEGNSNAYNVNCYVEKNRRDAFRTIPIRKGMNYTEDLMIEHFLNHLKNTDTETKLFDVTRQLTYNNFHKITTSIDVIKFAEKGKEVFFQPNWHIHPHYLRHCRLTHLVTYYKFNEFELQTFAGWSNIAPARIYIKVSASDLLRRFNDVAASKELPQNLKETETFKIADAPIEEQKQ